MANLLYNTMPSSLVFLFMWLLANIWMGNRIILLGDFLFVLLSVAEINTQL